MSNHTRATRLARVSIGQGASSSGGGSYSQYIGGSGGSAGGGGGNSNSNGSSNGSSGSTNETIPALQDLQSLQAILQRTESDAGSRVRQLADSQLILRTGGRANSSNSSNGNNKHIHAAAGPGTGPTKRGASASATPSSLGTATSVTNRGTKRSRIDSVSTDSSLSPAPSSSSRASSVDLPLGSQPGQSTSVTAPTSSRAGSPLSLSSSAATGHALGLSGTKVSSSSTSKPSSISSNAGSKGKAVALPGVDGIPGISAPIPSLPGFKKKSKQQKQASPSSATAPSSRRGSPAPTINHAQIPEASTSKLPPPPSSLPPRPASLPPKPPPSIANDDSRRESSIDRRAGASRVSNKGKDVDRSGSLALSISASGKAGSPPLLSVSAASDDGSSNASGGGERAERKRSSTPSTRRGSEEAVVRSRDFEETTNVSTTNDTHAKPIPSPGPPIARKTLPPGSRAVAALANTDKPLKPSNDTHTSNSSRPGTPIGRKNLPASVLVSHDSNNDSSPQVQVSRPTPSPTPSSPSPLQDDLPTQQSDSNGPSPRYPGASSNTAIQPFSQGRKTQPNGVSPSPSPGPALALASVNPSQTSSLPLASNTSSGSRTEESNLAKQHRREEKRKRKLAAAELGSTDAITPNGSPASKAGRGDSLPPNKMRKLEGSPVDGHARGHQISPASTNAGGLKVKLNGFTLNRANSNTPGSFTQPLPPTKKAVAVPGVADDFSLPVRPLVPPPPPLQVPQPTARVQSEVDEDFDHAKPSSQVPYNTFLNWVNDYLRNFGDDDLAFLSASSAKAQLGSGGISMEDAALFEVPPLGPHYQEMWQAVDAEIAATSGQSEDGTSSGSQGNGGNGSTAGNAGPGQANGQMQLPNPNTALIPPPLRRFKSENLTNEALQTENVYLGPLSERLLSAFRNTKYTSNLLEQATESSDIHVNSLNVAPPAGLSGIREMDAIDFESRLVKELAFLGAIPVPTRAPAVIPTTAVSSKKQPNGVIAPSGAACEPASSTSINWASREDDDISTSLRACQRLLRQQILLNEARKSRLADLVRERMAMQEYESLRDGLEAVIESAWHKRQRAAQRKSQKDKKDKAGGGGGGRDKEKDKDKEAAANLAASLAALNQPQQLSANLVSTLTKRRNLVDGFADVFIQNARGLPQESIYKDLSGRGRNITDRVPEDL